MHFRKWFFAALVLALATWPASAQTNTYTTPDCVLNFTLSSTGSSASLDNRAAAAPSGRAPCYSWTVTYYGVNGFTGAAVTFQDAPDANGTAGTWETFSGSVVSPGTNPLTASTGGGQASFTGSFPWLNVTATLTGTGTIKGTIQGWRQQGAKVGGGGGGSGDVVGPGSSVANDLPVFADTTGKLLADSGIFLINNPVNYVLGIGYQVVGSNTGSYVTALGYQAALNNTGSVVTATGIHASYDNTGGYVTATGYNAGYANTGNEVTATGYAACHDNTANIVTATGYASAYSNIGQDLTATGYYAARNNKGADVTATGDYSGYGNTGNAVTATGYLSAYSNTGSNVTATGAGAANSNTGTDVAATGYYAAYSNSGNYVNVMGDSAAYSNTGNYVTAIGDSAAYNNTGVGLVAIGQQAGHDKLAGDGTVIIGYEGTSHLPGTQKNIDTSVLIGPDSTTKANNSGATQLTNIIAINGAATGSNQTRIGNSGTTDALVYGMTPTLGDTLYGDGSGANARLPGNTSTTLKVLTQTGDGTHSAAPQWQLPPEAGTLTYYFSPTAADVATYLYQTTPPYSPKTTLTYPTLSTGTDVLQNWITQTGFPGLSFLPAGNFEFHIHALRSGGGTVNIFAEFWEVSSTGVDIGLIGTTETSTALTTSEVEYRLFFSTIDVYTFASTASRIVARVQVTVSGSSPTVQMFVGGEADSHISLPTNTVDASNFVPYTGATTDVNLGAHNLTAANVGPASNANIRTVAVFFDGGGAALSGTQTICAHVNFAGTIQQVTLGTVGVSGSGTVDIQTATETTYTSSGSGGASTVIGLGGTTPSLSSAYTYQDSTLTSWTTSVSANTWVCFVLSSPSTLTGLEADLKIAAN